MPALPGTILGAGDTAVIELAPVLTEPALLD